jgi:thymidylate synthase (FAD)
MFEGVGMKLIDTSFEVMSDLDTIMPVVKIIEKAIRNCYKSEDKITEDSYKTMISKMVDSDHASTLEHGVITVRVICSRACLAQWTRHRLMSYSVESQRYCNYSRGKFNNEVVFIKPDDFEKWTIQQQFLFKQALEDSEEYYLELIDAGLKAQDARAVLNNACKTEMVVTANMRAWRDFFKKRTTTHAQLEIRNIATSILKEFQSKVPVIFDDLTN